MELFKHWAQVMKKHDGNFDLKDFALRLQVAKSALRTVKYEEIFFYRPLT